MELIKNEWTEVLKAYPYLGVLTENHKHYSSIGVLEIIDDSEIHWGSFNVEIRIPKNYPKVLPRVYEIGGKLKKDSDWHINYDRSCCVGTNIEIYQKLKDKLSIKTWLVTFVIPFFQNQIYRLERGEYLGKVRGHFKEGLIQSYTEHWGFVKEEQVVDKLKLIVDGRKRHSYEKCFCGSNKRFDKCHQNKINFEGIPFENYEEDLRMIINS
ncbi:MAG: hypothetical protein WD512_14560 [Candidatus Paceibacterota bacterium]